MNPRVRFAPSPTGQLHLGGARTALSNFLFAKNQGGQFLVRIEDTDIERSKQEHTDQICESLSWLGLNWDDELVYQSSRTDAYKESLAALLDSGKAYRCYASKQELDNLCNQKGVIVKANFNSDSQVILSGEDKCIEHAINVGKKLKI